MTQVGRHRDDGDPRTEQGVRAPPPKDVARGAPPEPAEGHADPERGHVAGGEGGGDDLRRDAGEYVREHRPRRRQEGEAAGGVAEDGEPQEGELGRARNDVGRREADDFLGLAKAFGA